MENTVIKDKEKEKVNNTSSGLFGDSLGFASMEAYNAIRTNISFTIPSKQTGRIIGISSAVPQEGKSFTSINIAWSLAKDGNKVLLLDCDLRRPTIAKSLGISQENGLSNALVGQPFNFNKDLMIKGLDVVVSGNTPPNPSELIGSTKMGEFLDENSKKYDYIILDLPPIIPVIDAVTVSKFIDGIILVVHHNFSRKENVLKAVQHLEFANAKVLGFVYNGYRKGGGYYKKGYKYNYNHYSYYYGHKKSESTDKEQKKESK